MLIRVLDFQDFDQTIDLPDGSTVANLLDLVRVNFDYDGTHCKLYHNGAELRPGHVITNSAFTDNNTIVFFNTRIYHDKSYPKVDSAFPFLASRLQELVFCPSLVEETDGNSRPYFTYVRHRDEWGGFPEDALDPFDDFNDRLWEHSAMFHRLFSTF
jgi:hypothetical protein